MRNILYKRRQSLKNSRRLVTIRELAEDKDCKTLVRKSFIYKVRPAIESEVPARDPQIYVKKSVNNTSHCEEFSFRVKGSFFMRYGRCGFQVEFCHILRIEIRWKEHIFSPKKSETLT